MSMAYDIPEAPEVLDRREGPYGEVVLRRHGALLQIIANGCFLMDTSDGRSERRLVDAALAALTDGAARWTETFREGDWTALHTAVRTYGPRSVIDRVRALEEADRETRAHLVRSKTHDDATVVFVDLPAVGRDGLPAPLTSDNTPRRQ